MSSPELKLAYIFASASGSREVWVFMIMGRALVDCEVAATVCVQARVANHCMRKIADDRSYVGLQIKQIKEDNDDLKILLTCNWLHVRCCRVRM